MRIEYINPFVESSCEIIEEVLGTKVEKEELFLKDTTTPILGVAVFIGLAGVVRGRVLIDMSSETALNIQDVAPHKFKALLSYGKLIFGLGWILIAVSVIVVFVGLYNIGSDGAIAGGAILGYGITVAISGFFFLVFGQFISCFVSIEQNTRATFEILKEKG